MTTNIQVRAVENELAAAAKRRAGETHRSLSEYVRDLIAEDLARSESRRTMKAVLAEIADDRDRPGVPREEILRARAEVRRGLGVG